MDILLEPTNSTVTTDLTNSIIGGWLANGIDRPRGWEMWVKPNSNATTDNLNWELRNSTTNTNFMSNFITVANFNSNQFGQTDAQGFKLAKVGILNPSWSTPAQGDFVTLFLGTTNNSQWSIKTGTVVNQTFQLQPAIVPEPGSILLTALGVVAMAFLGWKRHFRKPIAA